MSYRRLPSGAENVHVMVRNIQAVYWIYAFFLKEVHTYVAFKLEYVFLFLLFNL